MKAPADFSLSSSQLKVVDEEQQTLYYEVQPDDPLKEIWKDYYQNPEDYGDQSKHRL